jgi:nucleoid DNA-binding protein
MKNFTRNDLAVELSLKLNITVDRAKSVVDKTIDALIDALADGKRLQFRNFGLLDVVERKPKVGRNPKNPEAGQYQIPARRMVRFRIGKHLFYRLNPE